jgi:carbon storage regulator
MLVLTRKLNESIMIGDSVEVTVVEVKGEQVKLGITAPKDVKVHRKEVYLAIQSENIDASKLAVDSVDKIGGIFRKKSKAPANNKRGP